MTRTIAIARHARRFAPALGLLLVVTLFGVGAHHHDEGRGHVCAVCTAGHAPAVAADLASPTAPPDAPRRALHAPTPSAPRAARIETASSRAPPRA